MCLMQICLINFIQKKVVEKFPDNLLILLTEFSNNRKFLLFLADQNIYIALRDFQIEIHFICRLRDFQTLDHT